MHLPSPDDWRLMLLLIVRRRKQVRAGAGELQINLHELLVTERSKKIAISPISSLKATMRHSL